MIAIVGIMILTVAWVWMYLIVTVSESGKIVIRNPVRDD